MKKKYTFAEFLAANEGDDFDQIEESWKKHFEKITLDFNAVHSGDCTKECCSCILCVIEEELKNYREYTFNEKKWRKENGV